jgi:peptidoglycan/xylan/chitin deacetylase (PgdA/CDA1 family)
MWPLFLLSVGLPSMALADDGGLQVPVLLYHKFDVETKQFTTVRDATLEQQLQELSTHGYQVIPLRDLVDYMLGKRDALPAKAVAITVDDGYRSVYDVLFPLLQRYPMPVTLLIYPAAISKDSWALSWEQLKTMQQSGLVDIEVHTYTHPNFALEKLQMSSQAYREFVHVELTLSKKLLEEHMGKSMDMIAWPFGYTDDVLLQEARNDGYQAAFSIDSLPVTQHSLMFQLPRIMMFERYDAKTFENTLRKITMSEEIRRHSETLPARMTNISY